MQGRVPHMGPHTSTVEDSQPHAGQPRHRQGQPACGWAPRLQGTAICSTTLKGAGRYPSSNIYWTEGVAVDAAEKICPVRDDRPPVGLKA
eukprot:9321604-Karenia_brevis.AAC.1